MYGMDVSYQWNVGIDFDETITLNPDMWLSIMKTLERNGFNVYVVTWRAESEWPEDLKFLVDKGYRVFYTDRRNKRQYMLSKGIKIDIMIDDSPESWCYSLDRLTGELYNV